MDITDFSTALDDNGLNFIIFESCYMASVECAYQLRNKAKYLLASTAEIVSPGFQPIYGTSLPLLFSKTADLTGFARQAFVSSNNSYQSATFSVINTTQLPAMVEYLRGKITPTAMENIDRASIQQFGRGLQNDLFFDLEDALLAVESFEPGPAWESVLSETVPYREATDGFLENYEGGYPIRQHSGLTLYIPHGSSDARTEYYSTLDFYRAVYLD